MKKQISWTDPASGRTVSHVCNTHQQMIATRQEAIKARVRYVISNFTDGVKPSPDFKEPCIRRHIPALAGIRR